MPYKATYYTAGVEFILGTVLLLCLLKYQTDFIGFTLVYFVIVITVVNFILLIALIAKLFKDHKALLPIAVLLLNIPVAILYVYIIRSNMSFE